MTSKVATRIATSVCYDADFYPFGGERDITSTCQLNYKFEGKERDTETNNDDFGARYYSSALGRWLSADWSAVPVPVPYANLTNPQTLNLYAMVRDNPESFADLDGHEDEPCQSAVPSSAGGGAPPMGGQKCEVVSQNIADQNSESGKEREKIKEETFASQTTYNGKEALAVTKSVTTTTTDSNGVQHVTITSTTAYFSTAEGSEGKVLGATQTTMSYKSDGGFWPELQNAKTSTMRIDVDAARKVIGNTAFGETQTMAASPDRGRYFGNAVGTEWHNHKWRMIGRGIAGGGAAACLFIPGCAEGAAGWLAGGTAAGIAGTDLGESVQHWRDQ